MCDAGGRGLHDERKCREREVHARRRSATARRREAPLRATRSVPCHASEDEVKAGMPLTVLPVTTLSQNVASDAAWTGSPKARPLSTNPSRVRPSREIAASAELAAPGEPALGEPAPGEPAPGAGLLMVASRTERRVQRNPRQALEACPPLAGRCTRLPDAGTVPLGRDNCMSLATFWKVVQPTPISATERANSGH